jgi:hypothetical protein
VGYGFKQGATRAGAGGFEGSRHAHSALALQQAPTGHHERATHRPATAQHTHCVTYPVLCTAHSHSAHGSPPNLYGVGLLAVTTLLEERTTSMALVETPPRGPSSRRASAVAPSASRARGTGRTYVLSAQWRVLYCCDDHQSRMACSLCCMEFWHAARHITMPEAHLTAWGALHASCVGASQSNRSEPPNTLSTSTAANWNQLPRCSCHVITPRHQPRHQPRHHATSSGHRRAESGGDLLHEDCLQCAVW